MSVDKETNNLSLFSIIESLQLEIGVADRDVGPVLPVPFPMYVVSLWLQEEGDQQVGDARLRLLFPNGETAIETALNMDFQQNRRLRTIARIATFPLQVGGSEPVDYWIQTELLRQEEWITVARVPIEVTGKVVTVHNPDIEPEAQP